MAETSFSWYDSNLWGGLTFNACVNATSPIAISVTGSTFKFTNVGTVQAKATCSDSAFFPASISVYTEIFDASGTDRYDTSSFSTGTVNSNTYGTATANLYGASFNTSDYFNSRNSTTRTISFTRRIVAASVQCGTTSYGNISPPKTMSTYSVTLNAPPTFNATATSAGPYYAKVSTYKVSLASLSAKYGGTISSAVLTVGNQTASRTTNGELAIALNTIGTFTPSVKVTDSRGQTTTVNLSPITVESHTSPTVTAETTSTGPYYTTGTSYTAVTSNPVTYDDVPVSSISLTIGSQTVSDTDVGQLTISPNTAGTFTPTVTITDTAGASSSAQLQPITVLQYSAPTMNGSIIQRTETSGKPNEEDTSAVMGYQITWVDALGHIKKPKIYIGSSTSEATVSWYKTYEPTSATETYLSNPITDWNTIVSGDVVYAFISDEFLIGDSYIINASVSDDFTTSAVLSMTLAQAFFTVDFLAGGHGIAFGQLATEEGFFCNMDAHFKDKANVMRALFDFVYPIGSYYETSDSSFNPNTAWGGTWVLETAGQVHVSAGTGYTIGATGGSTSKSYTPQGSVQNHTLTVNEMPSHAHIPNNWVVVANSNYASYGDRIPGGTVGAFSAKANAAANPDNYISNNTGGGAGHNHGFSGTQASINVMQPYITVNRWHRTA